MAGSHPREPAVRDGMIDFRILGHFEVWRGEAMVPFGGRKHRSLLTILILRARQLVPTEVLIHELWGETPPRTARVSLHNCVSQVRRAIGPGLLQTRDQGYLLAVDNDHVDLYRFELLLHEARGATDLTGRAEKLRMALGLWRGTPLADLMYEPFVRREAPRLEELHLAANLALIETELELGHAADVVSVLEALITEHPFHERLYAQLMLALYRAGRQGEALSVYGRARRILLEQLGIDPGPALRYLEQAILRQASELDLTVSEGGLRGPGRHRCVALASDARPRSSKRRSPPMTPRRHLRT